MTAFWRRVAARRTRPAPEREYTIQAPSYFAMPSISNGFQVWRSPAARPPSAAPAPT